ncbi:peptidase M4 [Oceanobacillus piezotolerans]|uniref:Peptidase M4 n=1 Tax=Oceanobacillus piezotolerans TaxID=2448030 RepID=A0A498D926_9BACI|nr:PepSY domain-containing protein [Oceanobacillus piezotolerans]RLL47793.1 peptidase M4 [Oceanobacillus piezotolerans]
MSKRNMVMAFAIGAAIGYVANQQIQTRQKVTPEKALKYAKESFQKSGPISGSWIYMKAEDMEKNGLQYKVYRGGITRNIDGENKQYEFFVDAETGGVISTVETA